MWISLWFSVHWLAEFRPVFLVRPLKVSIKAISCRPEGIFIWWNEGEEQPLVSCFWWYLVCLTELKESRWGFILVLSVKE